MVYNVMTGAMGHRFYRGHTIGGLYYALSGEGSGCGGGRFGGGCNIIGGRNG